MKKKRWLLVLGLIVVISGWWVLRGDPQPEPEVGVLDVWATWGDQPDAIQDLFERYAQNTGMPVRFITGIHSEGIEEGLTQNDGPDLVILSTSEMVGALYTRGLLEVLDNWPETSRISRMDIFPAALRACTAADGRALCMPMGCDVELLFWNKDLFKAAGLDPEKPPRTPKELVTISAMLNVVDVDGAIQQVGFIPDLPHSHTDLFMGILREGDSGKEDFSTVLDRGAIERAIQWQRQFYSVFAPGALEDFIAGLTPYLHSEHRFFADRSLSCQQCHRGPSVLAKKTPDLGFFEGAVAIMVDGEWQVSSTALAAERPMVDFGVTIFPAPEASDGSGDAPRVQGPVMVIPTNAQDPEAAARLLAWMLTPANAADIAYAASMLPASQAAAQDPRFHADGRFERFLEYLATSQGHTGSSGLMALERNTAIRETEETSLRE